MVDMQNSSDRFDHDLLNEECMSIAKAARRLPRVRGSKTPHPSTLYRWAKQGRDSTNGMKVYLEIVRVGGTNCTSMEALSRFFERLNDDKKESEPVLPKQKQTPIDKRAEEAIRTLRQRGLIK